MSKPDGVFRSGMAARLAGIPDATLRVWERRYGVGGAREGGAGHRRYSPADVARLALLKRLVDAGHAIGEIARLPAEALQQLEPASTPAEAQAAAAPLRVVVVGEALSGDRGALARRLDIAATAPDPALATTALRDVRADLLAVTLPTLGDNCAALVDSLAALVQARGVVVAYRFGTDDRVESLRGRGYVVARAPLTLEQLGMLASRLPAHARAMEWPAPRLHPQRFDEAALARLAADAATLACECPRHLVELLRSLGAFERYSAECAHRSPRDAELHRELQRVTSTARAMMEDALARVAAEDGLA